MFDDVGEKLAELFSDAQKTTESLTASVQSARQNLSELLDVFATLKNVFVAAVSFMGRETVVLLLCTALFLFVLNLVPFLFFGKKFRYGAGIVFGVLAGMRLSYSVISVFKFVLIMLAPVGLEFGIVFLFKKSMAFFAASLKKAMRFVLSSVSRFLRKTPNPPKEDALKDDEKESFDDSSGS